jgi:hypothetical protein
VPAWGRSWRRPRGTGDRYAGASDDELAGAICGWDRAEAAMAAGKHAAVAELMRPLRFCIMMDDTRAGRADAQLGAGV